MANHIQRSAACHAKFQALMNLVSHHDASQSASISNLPMDTGDKSTEMELDIQPPTPTDTDQVDVGATSDVDDPPPDDDDSDLQSDFSEQPLEDQLSDSEADSDVDEPDSTHDHPFSPPPQAIDTQEGIQFTMEFHPHSPQAGSSQRTGKTKWVTALEKEGPNPHFPWRDLEEWELVEWLVDQRLSQRSINDFIKNKWVCTST
jgi:hypothetical protein